MPSAPCTEEGGVHTCVYTPHSASRVYAALPIDLRCIVVLTRVLFTELKPLSRPASVSSALVIVCRRLQPSSTALSATSQCRSEFEDGQEGAALATE